MPELEALCAAEVFNTYLLTIFCSIEESIDRVPLLEQEPKLSLENQNRLKFLFENNLHDLPNKERPECHQEGHTYPSVYGRLYGDQPLYTITTGFGSPGRGRFIHPHKPRVINAREAARAQAFPDWYWSQIEQLKLSRNNLYKIIGDAVPSLMVTLIALC